MPLHPQVDAFLALTREQPAPRIEQSTAQEIRHNMRKAMLLAGSSDRLEITDTELDVEGEPIRLRRYRPFGATSLPCLVYLHGGGWVAGDLDTHDVLCRALASQTPCVLVAVDYRRAPEHRFPRAAEDALAATQWVLRHAPTWQVDLQRVAVAGDSAGGNLAAVVALMARDRDLMRPTHQILIYPITDANFATDSYEQFAEDHLLTRSAMQWFWDQYQPQVTARRDPYVAPLHAHDLRGLPPALVITAECDVLRDEGELYAARLQHAGVPTKLTRYPGMIHGFVHRTTLFDAAQDAVQQIGRWLSQDA